MEGIYIYIVTVRRGGGGGLIVLRKPYYMLANERQIIENRSDENNPNSFRANSEPFKQY